MFLLLLAAQGVFKLLKVVLNRASGVQLNRLTARTNPSLSA